MLLYVCACVRAYVRVRYRMRACARTCVRVCVCVRVYFLRRKFRFEYIRGFDAFRFRRFGKGDKFYNSFYL